MTTSSTQIPLQMRREDLASWENWLSRPETSALEQLLAAKPFPNTVHTCGARSGMGKKSLASGVLRGRMATMRVTFL